MTFSTGISSLQAHQTAMSVVGNNIANASTPGFRRQEVVFEENPHYRIGNLRIGTGVSIGDIRTAGDAALEAAILEGVSQGAMLQSQLAGAKQAESLFLPGTGTIQERFQELFLNLGRLDALPTESTLRSAVVESASGLATEIRRIVSSLDAASSSIESEIQTTISEINGKASEIHSLNERITEIENTGETAAGLRSQRDLMLADLATLIDVKRVVSPGGTESFVMGGGLFSMSDGLASMSIVRTESGKLQLWKEGCDTPLEITGGKLAGLLAQNNATGGVYGTRDQIGEFVGALVQFIDGTHATGVGIGSSFANLTGSRSIDETSASLSTAETISKIQEGSLHISINDEENDLTTLETIFVNPATDSLEDVAAQISTIDQLTARVDSQGRLAIVADAGYTFDFTGTPQTNPDTAGMSGTSVPTTTGRYAGLSNDNYSLTVMGNGTVGVTEGLQVEVRDQNNDVVRLLDVGTNYEPQSSLVIADGISVQLSSGTVVDGDTFDVQLVARPDETGLLAALGLNTLFVGETIDSLAVNPFVKDDPSRLATTTNGEPSDTFNLNRMLQLRDQPLIRNGSLDQFLSDLVGNVGREVGELTRDLAGSEERQTILENELSSVVGVDINEELALMLQYQRSYQAAARYISTINDTMQDLFQIIR